MASIKVGSPKLKGAGAPRAGSEAHWTTGHGARGRTGLARRLGAGGRGTALRGSWRDSLTRPPPLACSSSAAPAGPRHMHFAKGCMGSSASRPASLETLRTRAFPEVKQKRQKGNRTATAGKNIH